MRMNGKWQPENVLEIKSRVKKNSLDFLSTGQNGGGVARQCFLNNICEL